MISVDTKKKGLLGDFFRSGQAYTDGVLRVQDHDFVDAHDRLVPYGVFDTQQNEGFILLARGADTSELACDAVWRWWRRMGHDRWLLAPRLLLLCDCGGSNGYRQHKFKEDLADWHNGCSVTSKWRTIRRAARSTIRSNIVCSVT